MAILHIEDGRTRAWWSKLVLACALAGVALAWVMVGPGTRSVARAADPFVAACCAAMAATVAASAQPHVALPERITGAPTFDPVVAYRTARTYADCVALNERDVNGVVSPLEESLIVDPSGAMAAPLRDEDARRRAQCRSIGPAEYAQIESLMREAAEHGDPDARYVLLDRRVRVLVERAAADRTETEDETQDDHSLPAGAREAVAEAEALALQGHPSAMHLLGSDLLLGGMLAPPDPVRAAAWRLVMANLRSTEPMTVDDVIRNGQLVTLSADEAERIAREAQALRDACCSVRAP